MLSKEGTPDGCSTLIARELLATLTVEEDSSVHKEEMSNDSETVQVHLNT